MSSFTRNVFIFALGCSALRQYVVTVCDQISIILCVIVWCLNSIMIGTKQKLQGNQQTTKRSCLASSRWCHLLRQLTFPVYFRYHKGNLGTKDRTVYEFSTSTFRWKQKQNRKMLAFLRCPPQSLFIALLQLFVSLHHKPEQINFSSCVDCREIPAVLCSSLMQ